MKGMPINISAYFVTRSQMTAYPDKKEHLIGTDRKRKNVSLCQKVPPDVVEELKDYEERQKMAKRQQVIDEYLPELGDENTVEIDDEEDEDEQVQVQQCRDRGKCLAVPRSSSVTARERGSVGLHSVGSSTSPKRKGPMNVFLTFDSSGRQG